MAHEITVALIGIGSALLGTIVGGVATYYSNKAVKELDWKQSIKREELNEKKKLYSEFLAEANRLVMQSLKGKTNQISEFDGVANYIAQIQLISNESIIKIAVDITNYVLSVHAENENEKREKGFPELRKAFVKAAKDEFNEIISA